MAYQEDPRVADVTSRTVCPHCCSRETARSRRRSVWDYAALAYALSPYRCLRCLHRFYDFGASVAAKEVQA